MQLKLPTDQDIEKKLIHQSEKERLKKYIMEAEEQSSGNQTMCVSPQPNHPHREELLKIIAPLSLSEFGFP